MINDEVGTQCDTSGAKVMRHMKGEVAGLRNLLQSNNRQVASALEMRYLKFEFYTK